MRRLGSLLLMGAGILLFFGAGGWLYFSDLISRPAPVPLPDQIAGLPLTDQRTGAQAASDFFALHEKQFPLTSGAVGIYGNHQITLWVAGTPLNFQASQMVEAMREKIAEGNSPFTSTSEFVTGGRTVHSLEGMGQKHFYFQSKNLVIWVASDPAFADQALEQTLEAYP
jgi:hypothetical protein